MKSIRNLRLGLALAVLFATAFTTNAQENFFEREVKVGKNTTLTIDNKFGDIQCANWDSDRVHIVVDVTGPGTSEADIRDVVEIDFEASGNEVRVQTEIDGGLESQSVQIDYMIQMPAYLNIDFTNKFGSIYIETITGNTSIDNKFGAVQIGTLEGERNDIEIKFGGLEIDYIKNGHLEVSNGDTEIQKAENLNLESKFGGVELGKVKKAVLEVKNGSMRADKIADLEYEGAFGGVKIKEVNGSVLLENSYGNSEISRLAEDVKNVTIDNKFGKVKIGIHHNASFALICDVKMGSFYYPEEMTRFSSVESSMTSKSYTGTIGKGSSGHSMELESKNGDIVIFEY